MREILTALAAHLSGDATTLCRCWRVTRRDGVVLGFSEHDRNLTFAGTQFLAASGFAGTEARAVNGLAAPGAEVSGGFSSEAISEADLTRGAMTARGSRCLPSTGRRRAISTFSCRCRRSARCRGRAGPLPPS